MTRRTAFVFNVHAGASPVADWLDANLAAVERIAAGAPITRVDDGDAIRVAVETALSAGCDAVVGAGGDGTLSAVASSLVDQPADFGVLPMGTLNHFAKDLGIPLDPLDALRCIEAGHVQAVDVGEVNGRVFLNNSSIGLYVDLVRDRERQQARLGRGKWAAFSWALLGALRRYPFVDVVLGIDGDARRHRTPFVFVGNNAYRIEGLQIGQRSGLQGGVLSAYAVDRAGRWRLLGLGLRALLGRLREERDFHTFEGSEVTVQTAQRQLHVAVDGELCRLDAPLRYRSRPGALRVIVPAGPAAGADDRVGTPAAAAVRDDRR